MAAMIPAKIPMASPVEWLPAERLGQLSVDGQVRPWLIGKGLLTKRLKAVCGEHFSLRLIELRSELISPANKLALGVRDAAALVREVEMYFDDRLWVFAQTIMPDSTLSAHPWLAELGDAALGETMNDLSALERSSFEYAWLPAADALCTRALHTAEITPPGLWARRSTWTLRGAPLLVQDVFMPAMGRV
jgi:chorismate--pyruvate lyase